MIFVKYLNALVVVGPNKQTNKQTSIDRYTHVCNVVTLVWVSLRLTPTNVKEELKMQRMNYFSLNQVFVIFLVAMILPHKAIVLPNKCADFKIFYWTNKLTHGQS